MGFIDDNSSQKNNVYGFTTFMSTEEMNKNIRQASQGKLQAVLAAFMSSNNNTALPVQDLLNQIAAEPMDLETDGEAAAFAAAMSGSVPLSAGGSTVDPQNTILSAFHVATLRCLLNTESKPSERYNSLVLIATIVSKTPPQMRRTLGICSHHGGTVTS
ncbi:hypothetical protein PG996_010783 [Apiospora saccharicola]|uniref:Uncharacterized protein n=1 Tax=Apiospora saccharicola TaxID=335842 RepID=A0ABR1UPJ0_9PEZI